MVVIVIIKLGPINLDSMGIGGKYNSRATNEKRKRKRRKEPEKKRMKNISTSLPDLFRANLVVYYHKVGG